jgi:hypothetical protein
MTRTSSSGKLQELLKTFLPGLADGTDERWFFPGAEIAAHLAPPYGVRYGRLFFYGRQERGFFSIPPLSCFGNGGLRVFTLLNLT